MKELRCFPSYTDFFHFYQYAPTYRTVSGCFHHRSKCPGEDNVPCMKVGVASHKCALSSWLSCYHPGYFYSSKPARTAPIQRHPSYSLNVCPFYLYQGYSALSITHLKPREVVYCVSEELVHSLNVQQSVKSIII